MPREKGSKSKWILTVNPSSECYGDFPNIIKKVSCLFYAYIHHEADEDIDNDHYHAVLDFGTCVKTYDDIHVMFKGAHEEECASISSSCAYLTHETQKAKKQGKRLYDRKCVLSNDFEQYNIYADKGSLELFNPLDIVENTLNAGSYISMVKRFGVDAVQPYVCTIREILTHYDVESMKFASLKEKTRIVDFMSRILSSSLSACIKVDIMCKYMFSDDNVRDELEKKFFENVYKNLLR